MMRTRWLVISLAVLAAAAPRVFAQSASVQAQSLFDDGRKLLKAGKLAEACAAFDSSQKLDPAVTTLLNLADCREQNHQLATAWGAFVEANRMARASSNDKLARVATSHAQKLEPRLSKLTISVAADRQVTGLEILRGSEPIAAASWNHALPIDGGTYTITARAPGHTPWSTTTTIKASADAQTVEIPKLADAPVTPPVVSSTANPAGTEPSPVPTTPASKSADRSDTGHSLAWPIGLGVGALAFGGTAIGFHLSGNSTYDRAKVATTQAQQDSLYHSATNRRYLAQGFGVAAIGCAGVAVYLYIRGRGEHRADTTAIAPVASPQLTGLTVTGSW